MDSDIESRLRTRGIPMRLSLAAARELIATALIGRESGAERIALWDAGGRRLAEDVHIAHALPAFNNSAMDGYAYAHVGLQSAVLRCIGESRAGAPFAGRLSAGECVRISTGAMMPAGADTVVMQEHVERTRELVRLIQIPTAGANVRKAGEECAPGTRLLTRGTRLCARTLALAATAGRDPLRVVRPPRVAILSGGDELVRPGRALLPGQIFESNAHQLAALVTEAGGTALPAATAQADDPALLLETLRRCASAADLIVSTGGASVGDHDHLPVVLTDHGQVHFWKLLLKPGMPALFGEIDGKPVFALPGNPVSAYITFRALVWPALALLQGLPMPQPARWRARLSTPLRKQHARAEHQRGVHWIDAEGQMCVRPLTEQDSHRLVPLAQATVVLPLPEGPIDWPAGTLIEVEPIGLVEAA